MPDWVVSLFRSGRVADIALAVLALEILFIWLFRHRLTALALAPAVFNAASGIALILALRAALRDPSDVMSIGLFLSAGFVAHIGDLVLRLRTRG